MLENSATPRRRLRLAGLIAGPALAIVVYVLLLTGGAASGLDGAGRATLALMIWMAVWWITEAIDLSATALLPVAVLPLATAGAFEETRDAVAAATAPYANPFIALFLGGFIIALAMERWELHRRIALLTLRCVGARPVAIVAGFMAVTAGLSMWVSNTATTAMMLPIALSVCTLVRERTEGDDATAAARRRRANFAPCLMLGIAYAASVGGIGTLIGTPPNLLLAGFIGTTYGVDISFARWLLVGLPLVAIFLPLIWFLLARVIYPVSARPIEGGRALLRREYEALGPMKGGAWATLAVFALAAGAWIFRRLLTGISIGGFAPFAGLSDAGIAVIAALLLFVIPVERRRLEFVLNWAALKSLPWGILILFGGGLSLAAAVRRHGVAEFLGGHAAALEGLPGLAVVLTITTGVIFLTELTSNTATTATLLPILAAVAPALGLDPALLLVPAAIAASCAFMMPVATPPNAIVFGSGYVSIPQMCRAGLWLNLVGIVLVTALAYLVAAPLFSVAAR